MRTRILSSMIALAAALLLACAVSPHAQATNPARATSGLTAVDGIRVGHYTLTERPTGCTVILVTGGTGFRRTYSEPARP